MVTSRHPIWDALPDFPPEVDPDHPAHQDHPVVASLIANGGMWRGIQVGAVLADPRLILIESPAALADHIRKIAAARERIIAALGDG